MKGKRNKKDIVTLSMTKFEATDLYFAVNDAIEQLRKLQKGTEYIKILLPLVEVSEVIDGLKYTDNYISVLD